MRRVIGVPLRFVSRFVLLQLAIFLGFPSGFSQPVVDSLSCPFSLNGGVQGSDPFRKTSMVSHDGAFSTCEKKASRQRQLLADLRGATARGDSVELIRIHIELADSPCHAGDPLGSHMHYKQAFSHLSKQTPADLAFRIYYNLGLSYSRQHYYPQAHDLLDSARARLHAGCTPRERATLYLHLAELDRVELRYGNALSDVLFALEEDSISSGLRALVHIAASELYYAMGSASYGALHATQAILHANACPSADTVAQVMSVCAWRAYHLGEFDRAHEYADRTLKAMQPWGGVGSQVAIYPLLSRLSAQEGAYDEALGYLDSSYLERVRIQRQGADMEFARYTLNHEYQISWHQLLQRRIAVEKNLLADRRLSRSIVLMGTAALLSLVLGIYITSVRLWEKKLDSTLLEANTRRMEETNEKMQASKRDLLKQRKAIEQNNRLLAVVNQTLRANVERISGHLKIVSAIQLSLQPSREQISARLGEAFVYYAPCEMVSGDFYWWAKLGDRTLLAVVDCAGHGVPGGVMSFVGTILLNKIVRGWGITRPSEVLMHLHEQVQMYLGSQASSMLGHYSMDVSLVSIDLGKRSITFSGAASSLYMMSGGVLTRTRGSILSVGSMMQAPTFDDFAFSLDAPTTIYLATDGYTDQLDAKNRKFGKLGFMKLIESIHPNPMVDQLQSLREALQGHMGSADQTDDICIVGIKLRV